MSNEVPFREGSKYLIRTVTHYWTGRVQQIVGQFLVLGDAAWIADTGRFHKAKTADDLSEVEPVDGPVIVGLGAVVDAIEWSSDLPREPK